MKEYAIICENRFVINQHGLSGPMPDGCFLRSFSGAVPGNCIAIFSPTDSEYPDISIRNVTGRFHTLDDLLGTTRNLIAIRQCQVLSQEADLNIDGLSAKRLHYRDSDLEICKIFVLRGNMGYSVITSDKKSLDIDAFTEFVRKIDWHFNPRSLREMPPLGRFSSAFGLLVFGLLLFMLLRYRNSSQANDSDLKVGFEAALIIVSVIYAISMILYCRRIGQQRKNKRNGATCYEDTTSDFDVFLSYRSLNSVFVRAVAEALLSRGYRVWFAEYVILLIGRSHIRSRLFSGIGRSRAAVLFTNTNFSNSDWCRSEALEVTRRLPKSRVFQIMVPDEPLDDPLKITLDDVPFDQRLVCEKHERDTKAVLSVLLPWLGPPLRPPKEILHVGSHRWASSGNQTEQDGSFTVCGYGISFSMNTTGWNWVSPEKGFLNENDYWGPMMRRRFGRVRVDLQVGFWRHEILTLPEVPAEEDQDEVFEALRTFAEPYLSKKGFRCVGVHRIHVCDRPHTGLTYLEPVNAAWIRRYSLCLPHPSRGIPFEISIRFDVETDFQNFSYLAPIFDAVVESVDWRAH